MLHSVAIAFTTFEIYVEINEIKDWLCYCRYLVASFIYLLSIALFVLTLQALVAVCFVFFVRFY